MPQRESRLQPRSGEAQGKVKRWWPHVSSQRASAGSAGTAEGRAGAGEAAVRDKARWGGTALELVVPAQPPGT